MVALKASDLQSQPSPIAFAKVTLFTKPDCHCCTRAKAVLRRVGVPYINFDVTIDPQQYQASIFLSGVTTLPQIFIGLYHIDGVEDLEALERSGRLQDLLQQARKREGKGWPWHDLTDEELYEGAQDLALQRYIPPSDGSHTHDQEAWPILHFHQNFLGFWPNTYAYLHHWPEAYKLIVIGFIMSTIDATRQAIGQDMMHATAYSTSRSHGCTYCQVHSATAGGNYSLDAVEALEKAKLADCDSAHSLGAFEIALTELAARATSNQVSPELLTQIRELQTQTKRGQNAATSIQGTALVAAAFGFLNVFNDLTGLEIEGDWLNQATNRLGIEAGRHASQRHNPSNLDYELPQGGPSFLDMIKRYEAAVGDLEVYAKHEFGLIPAWLQAWPESLRQRQAYLYGELMGNRVHSCFSAELKHLMARVAAIAADHSYLAAVEGYMAYHTAVYKERAIERIKYCFLAARYGEVDSSLFSLKEQTALKLAWLSAQIPLTTPHRFIKPILQNHQYKELIQLIVVCSIAAMTQRFAAIHHLAMESEVERFMIQYGLEAKPLALRYPSQWD